MGEDREEENWAGGRGGGERGIKRRRSGRSLPNERPIQLAWESPHDDSSSAAPVLYDAGGILSQEVAVIIVGLLAASSTQIAIVALATFPFEI